MVSENFDRTLQVQLDKTIISEEDNISQKVWQSPFTLEISLSKDAYVIQNLYSFTLTNLLIDLGGISRSFYILGMVCAHFVSKVLYRKALIEDLFMW